MEAVNEHMARMRRAAGLSQHRLAKLAGMTQAEVCQFELGNRNLRADRLACIEAVLRRELERAAREMAELNGTANV